VSFHATPREGGNVDDGGEPIQFERNGPARSVPLTPGELAGLIGPWHRNSGLPELAR
jgi:hypothetical protein